MVCNKCGMQNNDISKFCIGCGNPLSQPIVNNDLIGNSNNELVSNHQSIDNNFENNANNELNTAYQSINNNSSSLVTETSTVEKEKKPINKKMLMIIGGILLGVIIVVLVIIFAFGGKNKSSDLNNLFDLNQPIPVSKDSHYVYIDTNGKILKDIKYNEARDFYMNYAFVELEDGTAALIDKNQNIKVKATSYYGIKQLAEYNLWLIDGFLYNGKLEKITDDSKQLKYIKNGFFTYNNADYTEYGIINSKGKTIYKNDCLISSLEINESTDVEQYYGILKTTCNVNGEQIKQEYLIELQTGKILYENEYRKTNQQSYYYSLTNDSNGIYYIYDTNYKKVKYFYVNNNKLIYTSSEFLYDLTTYGDKYLKLDYGYDYDELGKEQRYYYYNLETKKIENDKPELEQIDIKKEKDVTERQIVSCNNGKGLIDNKRVIIPCIYKNIEYVNDNVYQYMKQVKSKDLMIIEDDNENYIIYDANKRKEVIKFEDSQKSEIYDYDNSLLIKQQIYLKDNKNDLDKTIVHNLLTKQKIIFDQNSDIEIKSNYFVEKKDGKKIYYNMSFEKIYTEN